MPYHRSTDVSIALRPQPVGLFGFPGGHLILPPSDAPEAPEVLDRILRGDLSSPVPAEWTFFVCAARGDTEQAWEEIRDQTGELADYNRFVLQSTGERYRQLRHSLRGELRALLQVAAYACGLDDFVPTAQNLDGELRALVLATQATAELEEGNPFAARQLLEEACETARDSSPLLAAVYANQLGELILSLPGGSPQEALSRFQLAWESASVSSLPLFAAQVSANLASAYQRAADGRRGMLLEAVKWYQRALHEGASLEKAPHLYAFIQNHLGLAYMAMPAVEASDQLRMGIAVQAFGEALKVYDRETSPQLWASTQMNLANALQYLPSSHPAENLARAVDIYEEVLQIRKRALDPVGYARVLANQGNALSHLGEFQRAMKNLAEARTLFRQHELWDEAEETHRLIEAIHRRHHELHREVEASAVAEADPPPGDSSV